MRYAGQFLSSPNITSSFRQNIPWLKGSNYPTYLKKIISSGYCSIRWYPTCFEYVTKICFFTQFTDGGTNREYVEVGTSIV